MIGGQPLFNRASLRELFQVGGYQARKPTSTTKPYEEKHLLTLTSMLGLKSPVSVITLTFNLWDNSARHYRSLLSIHHYLPTLTTPVQCKWHKIQYPHSTIVQKCSLQSFLCQFL